jgi:solute carrier family 8 (sodium/calcium exchanger)
VETLNGTAVAQEDYIPFDQEVQFAANEELRQVYIEIVDDNEWEPDEFFFVKLQIPQQNEEIAFGNLAITQVVIINDDGKYSSFSTITNTGVQNHVGPRSASFRY